MRSSSGLGSLARTGRRFGARKEKPKKLFSAEEVRALAFGALVVAGEDGPELVQSGPQMRAMILLGLNCGYGNADVGRVKLDHLDVDGGWSNYHREKTGIDRRCRSAGLFFSEEESAAITSLAKMGDTLGVQGKILEVLEAKYGGVGAAMANTTEGTVAALRNTWNSIVKSIGDIFVPAVRLVADISLSMVKSFKGMVTPIFGDIGTGVKGVIGDIRGWIDENVNTFRSWGELVGGIMKNPGA